MIVMKNWRVYFICALLATSCARNPVTGTKELSFVSETQEIDIGQKNFLTMQQAEGGPYTADPTLCDYVAKVGAKLAAASARNHLPYEFVIVNDATPNAWTLPGGKIAINRGLLTELGSEAELAAVLGHEIVHADARHGAKGIERGLMLQGSILALGVSLNNNRYNDILVTAASAAAMLVHQKYGRNQELEADRFGMIYMNKAGYDPAAAVDLQKLFLRLSDNKKPHWVEGLFASHPPSQERIVANQQTLAILQAENGCLGQFSGQEEYQKATAQLRASAPAYEAYEKGKKALNKKDYTQTYQQAQKALSLCNNEALFWHLKGQALLGQKKTVAAQKALSQAIHYTPSNFDFYLSRAQASYRAGKLSQAKQDLEYSLSLLPTGEGHEFLGRLLLQEGDTNGAKHHFTIASHAESPAGKRATKALEKLSKAAP